MEKLFPNSGPKIISTIFWVAMSHGMTFSHFMYFQDASGKTRE